MVRRFYEGRGDKHFGWPKRCVLMESADAAIFRFVRICMLTQAAPLVDESVPSPPRIRINAWPL